MARNSPNKIHSKRSNHLISTINSEESKIIHSTSCYFLAPEFEIHVTTHFFSYSFLEIFFFMVLKFYILLFFNMNKPSILKDPFHNPFLYSRISRIFKKEGND